MRIQFFGPNGSRVVRAGLAAAIIFGLVLALACTEQQTSQAPPQSAVSYDPTLPLVLQYSRAACPWCVKMGPVLRELAAAYSGRLNVSEVSVDNHAEFSRRAGIRMLPTIIIYKPSGEEVYRHVGYWPEEEIVSKLRELGMIT